MAEGSRTIHDSKKRCETTMQEKLISNIKESVAKQLKHGGIHTLARMVQNGEHP